MSLLRVDFAAVENLISDFDIKLYNLPRDVQKQMIDIAAKHVLTFVRHYAKTMARGQYSLGESDKKAIANAAYIDTKHFNDFIPYVEINFKGTVSKYYEPRSKHPRATKDERRWGLYHISEKTGITDNGKRRIAEIAFLNEYGVPRNKNQGARGYLSKAMTDGMARAIDPILDVLEKYIAQSLVI